LGILLPYPCKGAGGCHVLMIVLQKNFLNAYLEVISMVQYTKSARNSKVRNHYSLIQTIYVRYSRGKMQIKQIRLICMEATTHGYLRLTSAGPKHEIFITKEEIKGSIFLVLQGIKYLHAI
jgi:hypothetical protein